jgi:hypothetical protein
MLRAFDRVEENALRAADRPNRLEPPLSNPVVNRSTGYAEQLRSMVKGNATADTRPDGTARNKLAERHKFLRRDVEKARLVPRMG